MSATRSGEVLARSSAKGRDLPAPRWSRSAMEKTVGSKKEACAGVVPLPGPPWRNITV